MNTTVFPPIKKLLADRKIHAVTKYEYDPIFDRQASKNQRFFQKAAGEGSIGWPVAKNHRPFFLNFFIEFLFTESYFSSLLGYGPALGWNQINKASD